MYNVDTSKFDFWSKGKGRAMTKQMIEKQFAIALRKENIQADVTLTGAGISICVSSEAAAQKAQALMSKIKTVVFDTVDFYAADEDGTPAEWYLRYTFA